jgi:hypothetical protein
MLGTGLRRPPPFEVQGKPSAAAATAGKRKKTSRWPLLRERWAVCYHRLAGLLGAESEHR